jgi:hypothetical protein
MGDKYQDAPKAIVDLAEKIRAELFPELKNATVQYIYNMKPRWHHGNRVFATIQGSNEKIRFLTATDTDPEGVDYFMEFDGKLFDALEDPDRTRIIRHEFRHTFFDANAKKNPYKTVAHDFEDFHVEVAINKDEPMWKARVGAVCESVHDKDD